MKLTMLGTGHAVVTECYNTCFVLSENNRHFLVDGGGGSTILTQLKRANINIGDIKTIFVTHKHIDHILGVVWMMRVLARYLAKEGAEDVYIYGHDEVIELLRDMAEKLLQKNEVLSLDTKLHLVAVEDGEAKTVLGHPVTFFDIHSTKAKQFGFSMDLGDGKKLTCCGDEPYNECEKKYAENSTWMLHEAFCLYAQADIFSPYEKHHSTVKDACELAEQLHVKNLILYHTEDTNLAKRKELYTAEGQEYYKGNLYVPYDLDVFEL